MNGSLFGFLPVVPLRESFAHAYPDIVSVHMILSFFGAIIFFFSVCYLVVFLFIYFMRTPEDRRKEAKTIAFGFLWAFVFGFFGLYTFAFVLMYIGAMGYKQYS